MIEAFGFGVRVLPQFDFSCPPGSDHTPSFQLLSMHTSETNAAFFSADYRIDERWLVTGGLRYSKDIKDRPGHEGDTIIAVAGVPLLVDFGRAAAGVSSGGRHGKMAQDHRSYRCRVHAG